MKKIIRYLKRKIILLNKRYFYRSINGNFVHPHLMTVISSKELYDMSEKDFDIL